MKRKELLVLLLGIFTWYSCSKNEVTPTPAASTTSFTTPTSPLHFASNSLASLTSYTPSSAINMTGAHDITISGKSISGGSAPSITLTNCYNVHITQNSLGNTTNNGIYLFNCYNITVDYNFITNVSCGVYVSTGTGGIVVNNNQMLNMQGPFPRGQFVQFNTVKGAGNTISNNQLENISGKSNSQEAINLYMSNGTAASPITVNGNWIRGGGPGNASGGIQLGDTGGSYESASNNMLVNPGQMGLSISGGDHISLLNNQVFAVKQSFTNVGIVVWAQAGASVTNPTVSGNKIKYINAAGAENDSWIGPSTPTPAGWSTNVWNASITASILPTTIISSTAATIPLQSGGTTTPPPTTPPPTTPPPTNPPTGTTSAPVVMTGRSGVTISNLVITGGTVPCIKLTNCTNVYITTCTLQNSTDVGIELDNCTNVTIEKNNILNVAAGVVANGCPGGGISLYTNKMQNMKGSAQSGAFVRFISVGGANNNISFNKLQNIAGASNPVNAIDIVSSNGTSASPITIDGNNLRGGGPSTSGGGILLGDAGGSNQIAKNNILADPGQYGIAIAGGANISLVNNSVYGKQQAFTNVGLYVWSQASKITNSTVSGNKVKFVNKAGAENDNWLATGETTPTGWSTNTWNASISESILPTPLFTL
jgi:parallel beta-helix repeat protein